jgi:hypothetical protein
MHLKEIVFWGHGLDSIGFGEVPVKALVNTVMNLLVPYKWGIF